MVISIAIGEISCQRCRLKSLIMLQYVFRKVCCSNESCYRCKYGIWGRPTI